jgi:hypothetical protein
LAVTWATTDDVTTYTGATVTDAVLTAADTDITVYANRTESASAGMSARDLHWLRLATCYQAAWRAQQVNVEGRQGVQAFSQDGMSVQYRAEHQVVLAPMAARSLKNLSWKADRTSRVPNVQVPRGLGDVEAGGVEAWFLDESHDEASQWNPL